MAHVYLPDSWVLAVDPGMNSVSFLLEAVLTADHPAYYWPPRPGEQYPYALLRWTLRGEVHWNEGPNLDRPATDANGEIDFGNIDAWWQEGDVEHLSGEWGDVTVRRAQHFVEYVPQKPNG